MIIFISTFLISFFLLYLRKEDPGVILAEHRLQNFTEQRTGIRKEV